MAALERVKAKYKAQNPARQEQFVEPPDWTIAVAAVLDEIMAENQRIWAKIRKKEA